MDDFHDLMMKDASAWVFSLPNNADHSQTPQFVSSIHIRRMGGTSVEEEGDEAHAPSPEMRASTGDVESYGLNIAASI